MAAALSLNLALPLTAMPASLAPPAPAAADGAAGMGSFADLLAGAAELGFEAQAMAMPAPATAPDAAAPAQPAPFAAALPATPLTAPAPATPALPAASPVDALPVEAAPPEPKPELGVAGGLPAGWLQNFERVLADAQALLDARPLPGAAETAAALDDLTLAAGPGFESDTASLNEPTSDAKDLTATEVLPTAVAAVTTPVASFPATPAQPIAAPSTGAAGESGDPPDAAADTSRAGTAPAAHAAGGGAMRGQRAERGVPAPTARAAAAALSNAAGNSGAASGPTQVAEPADRSGSALLAPTDSRGGDGLAPLDPASQAAAQTPGNAAVQPPAASSTAAIANAAVERHASGTSALNDDTAPAEPLAHAEAAHVAGASHGAPRMTDGTSFAATLKQAFEAPLSATPGTPGFAPALGVQLSTLLRNGVAEARLHLHPAELGPIAVQIALEGTAAQVQLAADHSLTRQALEQALPQLASALRDAGFTLAGGSVSGQAGQAGDFAAGAGNSGPRNGAGGHAAGHDPAGGAGGAGGPGGAAAEATARAQAGRARRGLVDLYA